MRALIKRDFLFPLHIVSLGIVAAVTTAVFFGIAFLWLAPPSPTAPSENPDPPLQALELQEVPPPANSDTVWGQSMELADDSVAAIPTPSTLPPSDATAAAAPSNGAASALLPPAAEATLAPPAKITHTKKGRVVRYYRQVAGRRWAALWRPDASAGPNPGGGFYGPPNANVGYINPR
jgi:hypothetical protein